MGGVHQQSAHRAGWGGRAAETGTRATSPQAPATASSQRVCGGPGPPAGPATTGPRWPEAATTPPGDTGRQAHPPVQPGPLKTGQPPWPETPPGQGPSGPTGQRQLVHTPGNALGFGSSKDGHGGLRGRCPPLISAPCLSPRRMPLTVQGPLSAGHLSSNCHFVPYNWGQASHDRRTTCPGQDSTRVSPALALPTAPRGGMGPAPGR